MVHLGEVLDLHISDLTHTGEGVAKYNGFTIFVDDAVKGDDLVAEITLVKKNYAKAKILKIERPSILRKSDHVECPYKKQCGGCSFFDVDYSEQLYLKYEQVVEALKRIGGFEHLDVHPIIGMGIPYHYRNKAQYKVSEEGLGFYEKGSHKVCAISDCLTQPECSRVIMALVKELIEKYQIPVYHEETHQGLLRGLIQRTNREGQSMLVFVINGKKLPHQDAILDEIRKNPDIISVYLNINQSKGNKILGDKSIKIYGEDYLTESISDKTFQISPTSFFQVNTQQTEVLYEVVKQYADLKPGERLFDLYCGTGTIGIYVADQETDLTGVEINEEAVQDAIQNAQLNQLKNAKFYAGKAEVVVNQLDGKPDCVILDPPRKGCHESLLSFLLDLKVQRIVYVSCNPSTLARDLKILNEEYQIEQVQPVDLFPMTGHVETVVLLSRSK